ncbi:MAG: VCBS repeat-containing protein [Thermoplasmata archaeon]|nr:MAG: VCBS repeat-containing protein [Thermoplasmata archaeon]
MRLELNRKKIARGQLSILVAFLFVFSIMDAFSMTVYNESERNVAFFDYEPQDDGKQPDPHGVRSEEPIWSPYSGSLPDALSYYSIDFGDVNNDGKLDIVVGGGQNPSSDGIHCWVGDGFGGWSEESSGLPTSQWRSDVELGDLNNDGKLDIACGGLIYTGNGGAGGPMVWTSENNPSYPWLGVALGDVNNDGILDIAAGTDNWGIKIWVSNGKAGGSFIWTNSSGGLPTSGQYYGTYLGDVNNDGNLDLAAATNEQEGIRVWTGNGESGSSALWTDVSTSTGLPTTGDYSQVCFGDANNDGKLDVAGSKRSGGVKFYKGNGGEGGFSWVEESNGLATTNWYYGLAFGDVNNDGNLDLVGANYTGRGLEVWLGDGGSGGSVDWSPAREGLLDISNALDLCLGDVNNDGRLDIGVTSEMMGIQVWAGNLPDLAITGWTSVSSGLPTSSGYYDVIFGDINHDGKLDLAGAGKDNQGIGVWLGDGTGNWAEVSDFDLPSNGDYCGVRLKDVNHDGNLDLIASSDDQLGVLIWPGDGTGGFGAGSGPTDPASPPNMAGVEVADINCDGNVDIATCYYEPPQSGDKVYAWLGDGSGGWGSDIGPPVELGFDDVALGDVDHDGKIDLLATAHMQGYRFWLGDGTGGWSLQPQNGLPSSSGIGGLGVCFGDVNHDGDLDIAVGSWAGSYGVRVYTSDGGDGGAVDWVNDSVGLPTVGTYGGVEFGDINNDGNLDILSANAGGGQSNGISLALGNGGEGGSMVWTDSSLPDLPLSGNYWGVALGDINNDGILDIAISSANTGIRVYITQTQPTYQINLLEGWNLISLPLIQSDPTVYNVLGSISGEYKAVQCYDTDDANDPWKHYNPDKPSQLNDLTDLDHTMGIWIYITEPGGTTLTVYGGQFSGGQSITIRPGWNLAGFPSQTDKLRDVALNNTVSDIDYVGYFDASTDRFVILTDSDYMEVGRGYYIHSTNPSDIVWNVPL